MSVPNLRLPELGTLAIDFTSVSYSPNPCHKLCLFPNQLPVFACFNLIFVAVVYFLYPETANRTLEDLDAYFDRDSGHKTIIPIDDKVAKQTARPLEAIEAEARRVAEGKTTDLHKVTAVHVEDV